MAKVDNEKLNSMFLNAMVETLVDQVNQLDEENEKLRTAAKNLINALRFSSEWHNEVQELEKLVGDLHS